jgi:hypothetical protein
MVVIWVMADHNNPAQMNNARVALYNYIISQYGRIGHNVYMNVENDTVAATITFDLNVYPGRQIVI